MPPAPTTRIVTKKGGGGGAVRRLPCAQCSRSMTDQALRRALAVDGLSFRAEPGRVLGFLGPNGAGKTTTLRMLLGLTLPDLGRRRPSTAALPQLTDPITRGRRGARGAAVPSRPHRAQPPARARHRGGPAGRRVDEVLAARRAGRRGRQAGEGATRSGCASGSASPARCSATRARWCSTSPRTGSTRRASAGCATSCARGGRGPDRAGLEPRARRGGADRRRGRRDQPRPAVAQGSLEELTPPAPRRRCGCGAPSAERLRARAGRAGRRGRARRGGGRLARACAARRSRRWARRRPRTASPYSSCTGRASRSRASSSS